MEKIKVLIADDDKNIGENIKRVIEKIQGIEIVGIACDGEEEYKFIQKYEPDFLFSDVQMPKMSGIETLEKLNSENFKKIPTTVFVTGENINIFYNTKITNNIYDIISKPFCNDKIINIMKNYIYEIKQFDNVKI